LVATASLLESRVYLVSMHLFSNIAVSEWGRPALLYSNLLRLLLAGALGGIIGL